MTTMHALLLVGTISALAGTTPVAAAPVIGPPQPRGTDLATVIGTKNIPPACARFTSLPADAKGSPLEWNQALSLAACMQDAAIADVADPEDLDGLVQVLSEALAPSLMIYLGILESAPGPVQLRAAFQVGLANVALITRARCSLVTPKDLVTNPEAAARYRKLHAVLEPLLAHAKRTSQVAFTTVVRAAATTPMLVRDPVAKAMVQTARETLEALSDETSRGQPLAR